MGDNTAGGAGTTTLRWSAQLPDSGVEEVVDERVRVVAAKLHEERLLTLVVDVVHKVGVVFVSGTMIVMNGTSPSDVSKPGIATPFWSNYFSRVKL